MCLLTILLAAIPEIDCLKKALSGKMLDIVDHGNHFLNLEPGSGSGSASQQFGTADVLPNDDGSDDCEILGI